MSFSIWVRTEGGVFDKATRTFSNTELLWADGFASRAAAAERAARLAAAHGLTFTVRESPLPRPADWRPDCERPCPEFLDGEECRCALVAVSEPVRVAGGRDDDNETGNETPPRRAARGRGRRA